MSTPYIPGKVTAAGRDRCIFDMFIRRKPQYIKPGQEATWCHRGDKYTDDANEMLPSLIRMFKNHHHKWVLAIIADNRRPADDPERVLLKIVNGVIEENRLKGYLHMLQRVALPEIIQLSL